MGWLYPGYGHHFVVSSRNSNLEIHLISGDDFVRAGVGCRKRSVDTGSVATPHEDVAAVVKAFREVDERSSMCGRLHWLQSGHLNAQICESRCPLPLQLFVS